MRKTESKGPTRSTNGDAGTIRHNAIRDAMAEIMDVPTAGVEALGARVKALLGLGLRRDSAPAPGRGRSHRNGLPDALDVALALTLQRAFVPPVAAASLITGHREAIDSLWSAAARGEEVSLTVVIDALSHLARRDVRTGRFSEDPAGTLRLADPQERAPAGEPLAPPRITVDLRALHRAATDALLRAEGGTRRGPAPDRSTATA